MKKHMDNRTMYKVGMVLLDVIAVNGAFWFALLFRFFIGFEFRAGAHRFVQVLLWLSPLYSVAAIVIFALMGMYNTLWKIAGIRDINKIIKANLAAAAAFVLLSLVTGNRMPISTYFIGPVIQMLLVGTTRMGIKLMLMERDQVRSSKASIGAMVVGIRFVGRSARNQIDHSGNMITKCVVDTQDSSKGRTFDGVPVIGLEEMQEALERYHIAYVVIADASLSGVQRREIRQICAQRNIEVADMTGFGESGNRVLSPEHLLQQIPGAVTLVMNGQQKAFDSAEQAALSLNGSYLVKSIVPQNDRIRIEMIDNPLVPNDTSEAWVSEYKEETGSDVSFF